jgi:HK97 family phage major capsid protein
MTDEQQKQHDELMENIKGKTAEQIEAAKAEILKTAKADFLKDLEDLKTGALSEKQFNEKFAEMQKNLVANDTSFIELKKDLEETKESLNKLEEANVMVTNKENPREAFVKELADKKDDIKAIASTGKSVTIDKATAQRSSISGNVQSMDLPDVGQLATAERAAYDLFRKFPLKGSNNQGLVRYYDWDEDTKVRAAAMVAEGGTFPESTAAWKMYSIDLKKIGDSIPMTEELLEDEEMFANELDVFLSTNIEIERNDQIINGDGTGENLTGLKASSPAYVPAAAGITDASIYDLIVKVVESITTTGGKKYSPDFAIMNPADINKMKLKKDANNNYILPPFSTKGGTVVNGIVIIEDAAVTVNTMVVGDSRYGRIYEKAGIVLSRGLVNAQFTSDQMTLKARQRILFLIRTVDQTGFKEVTDIDAALVTLAS